MVCVPGEWEVVLTYWGHYKIADILQKTFTNNFLEKKTVDIDLELIEVYSKEYSWQYVTIVSCNGT